MTDDSGWLTWTQAAELAGCPVSTVEHYARIGRIERRQVRGRGRGSLERRSVEAFASWWREEVARRKRRRADHESRRIRPPEPQGWIQATEAAEQLGFAHSDHVVWLARQGRLEARKVSTRWWVRQAEVAAYAGERQQWVSWMKAAMMVGCSHETIRRAVAAGRIEKRDVHRTRASLSLSSVLEFRETFSR
ncbi:hypothetical protein [Nocardioides sp. CCNWLW216]|uniref:hypothetical protein n=1 Tax=Nocardioides sp. CCNWLW216 TaxID=3125803 RepID=UPI003014A10F